MRRAGLPPETQANLYPVPACAKQAGGGESQTLLVDVSVQTRDHRRIAGPEILPQAFDIFLTEFFLRSQMGPIIIIHISDL